MSKKKYTPCPRKYQLDVLTAANASFLRKIDIDAKRIINSLNVIPDGCSKNMTLTDEIKDYIAQHNYIACKLMKLVKSHADELKSQLREASTTDCKTQELLNKYPDL